ncbi:MAG: formylglycine-generating enzyme family protein [Planctomycetes bacterium]|nr:formylglycine-generating enzyme family protein [Planctomycetota bacterium]
MISTSNISLRGNVFGIAGEEGRWHHPKSIRFGNLEPEREHTFQLRLALPVACNITCDIAGVRVEPDVYSGSAVTDVVLRLEALSPGTHVRRGLIIRTRSFARHITIAGNVAAKKTQSSIKGTGQLIYDCLDSRAKLACAAANAAKKAAADSMADVQRGDSGRGEAHARAKTEISILARRLKNEFGVAREVKDRLIREVIEPYRAQEIDDAQARLRWKKVMEDHRATLVGSGTDALLEATLPQSQPAPAPASSDPPGLTRITNSIGMELVQIPAGEFLMGSPDSDPDAMSREKPQHRVRIAKPFFLGVHPVTQEQYQQVTGTNPSFWKGATRPVERVSWGDAVEFCRRLSTLPDEAAAGRLYRLPTEAEWEYACRAGSTSRYCFGADESQLVDYAWFSEHKGTQPVGRKKPNAWGLHDMHGNVWEWCSDWYKDDYHEKSPTDEPTGPVTGSDRVGRGGGWGNPASGCRAALRCGNQPGIRDFYLGFRVAAVLSGQ